MWLPAFLNTCLVSERGKRWMFLFFTVSVSLLARSVLLISFPAHMGCQTLLTPVYYAPLCALLLHISALPLQLFSHLVGVLGLPTQRKQYSSQWLVSFEAPLRGRRCPFTLQWWSPPHCNLEDNLRMLGRCLTNHCNYSPLWRESQVLLCIQL